MYRLATVFRLAQQPLAHRVCRLRPHISNKRDSIMALIEFFLESNPHVQGVSVGFEPQLTTSPERGYCPYVMRMPDGSYRRVDAALERDYYNYPWYKDTKELQKQNWSKPMRELNGTVTSGYSVPLYDASGKFYGVLLVDIGLSHLNEILQTVKPYPNAMLTVVDKDGTFIAHPNPDYILEESILSLCEKNKQGANLSMWDSIKKGVRGIGDYTNPTHGKTYVFYASEPKTGWTVTLEVPENEIAPGLLRMGRIQLTVAFVGILAMVIVLLLVIRRQSKPIEDFAKAACNINKDNYDLQLEEPKEKNELYELHHALSKMCKSIKTHVTELQEQRNIAEEQRSIAEEQRNIAEEQRGIAEEQRSIAEKAQKVAERANEMKGEFILNMMHEIRTPLNHIKGFSAIISDTSQQTEPEMLQEASNQISTSTSHLTHLLDDILLLGKYDNMNNVELTPTSAVEILLTAMMNSPQSDPNEVEMQPVIDESQSELTLNTNMDMAQRALSCLIGNAVKFTKQGHIKIGIETDEAEVRYYVEDTGIGIPAGEEKRIFERFVKLDEFVPGTGLGLSLAEAIVTSLDGTVYVDTTYAGPGARFVMALPKDKKA